MTGVLDTAKGNGERVTVPTRAPLRLGPVSGVLRLRPLLVLLGGLVVLLVGFTCNLALGEYPITPLGVLRTLVGGGDGGARIVIMQLRLPRSLTGLLVGAALGLAGALMQAVIRNPLASPDLLGITSGAGAAATAVIVLGGTLGSVSGLIASVGLPVVALLGGVLSGLLLHLLAYRSGVDSFRLVLVGVGVNALAVNTTLWLLTLDNVQQAGRAMVWLTGSLNARGWENAVPVGLALAVLVPVVLVGAHALGALQFDDDTMRGLGVRVTFSRSVFLLAAAVLASLATAAAGPIAFVALATPQIALRLSGTARPPLLASMVLGATLVLGADVISRTAFGTLELPVGVITAVLGAPYLIYLLVHRYREVRT
ncbi:iron complex transport system permease protein [Halopolyspora algeriensis]|uniref:Iron complex transport system permease protein n=1 Tax=Halopolyspora algeriensis TaxID=1500506 RepID=A0A368VKH6_9ACTN|nr:iron ABC transporter permease [Halopolyspora algeriensis]RCW40163.1 iron complex transport system permease protein [Halopolyspora algeriensis]TQM46355.1 iron complex transport system permease protein [Halopolyspora algeriensis]